MAIYIWFLLDIPPMVNDIEATWRKLKFLGKLQNRAV
jgi:hypothetical protein